MPNFQFGRKSPVYGSFVLLQGFCIRKEIDKNLHGLGIIIRAGKTPWGRHIYSFQFGTPEGETGGKKTTDK
ncbi:Uncharacterized protein dnm_072970 [Desulfonema magnum]|uniref:Uncharacterized protein n=1 Tax=Desulfonema magnum TaxID=45655 RepID=A0A975BTM5_9BACT|nr:Uncharacterized protein dnm_072970 [Desulfonema magnum]